jgi:hypothetical protein
MAIVGTKVRGHAAVASVLLLGLLYAAAVGFLLTGSRRLAVIATLVAVLAAFAARRTIVVAVLAVPGIFLIQRAPAIDVSFTDVIVSGAAVMAFAAGMQRRLAPHARVVLASFAFYLGLLLGSVVFNHSVRSDLEWFHRVALVAGSILVGAWLVHERQHVNALRLLLLVTCVLSAVAVFDSVTNDFDPAYPLWFHKNFMGSTAATTLLVAVAAPDEFRLPPRWLRLAVTLSAAGLVASQSRAAMLAAAAGLFIWFFRTHPDRRRQSWKLAVVALVFFVGFVGQSVRTQVAEQQGNRHSSISQRIEVETATQQLWKDNPMTGVGLRFFATPRFEGHQPPNNVLNEVLAEAGVPGLLGFLVFLGGAIVGLARGRGPLALAGLCVVSGRFVHGLLDIYWVAGTTTLPWLIAGMGLAATVTRPVDDPSAPAARHAAAATGPAPGGPSRLLDRSE